MYYFNQTPCETATETRVNSICYKDITKKPLIVGIVTSPKQYSEFKTYLKKQLGSQAIDVVVEGNSEITYKEAQNNISTNKWDIVFANSPMNGMRAKDNSYKWLVRMFPKYLLSYQSALFVISDSSIKSIKDINSTTTIALGDFNSASSFYMPTYDLYGKSMTVTAGHRSSKIRELVANKQADIGAVVYTTIKDDPQFRVIQISREIPGTGVYLSPKLTPTVQKQIQNILENAPKKIKEQANYDIGKEPDYKQFRTIALRVDQVLSCANFSRNPVQFFCNATSQGILGRVAGFTNQGNGTIRLRLERENHKTCQVFVSSQTLNKITDGSSPEIINRKQVNIIGVEPIELEEGTCQLTIENPTQLVVLQPGA
nr:PhnD/SsuA/transferrin family substrate-binding protein [Nostoc commune]